MYRTLHFISYFKSWIVAIFEPKLNSQLKQFQVSSKIFAQSVNSNDSSECTSILLYIIRAAVRIYRLRTMSYGYISVLYVLTYFLNSTYALLRRTLHNNFMIRLRTTNFDNTLPDIKIYNMQLLSPIWKRLNKSMCTSCIEWYRFYTAKYNFYE